MFSSGSGAAPTAPEGRGRLWGHLRDAVSQAGARRVHVPRLGVSGLTVPAASETHPCTALLSELKMQASTWFLKGRLTL